MEAPHCVQRALPASMQGFLESLSFEARMPDQCTKGGVLRYFRSHCPRQLVRCDRCDQQIQHGLVATHRQSECVKRQAQCAVCREWMTFDVLSTHRDNVYSCSNLVPCPNKCLTSENNVGSMTHAQRAVLETINLTTSSDMVMPVSLFMPPFPCDVHANTCLRQEVQCIECGGKYQRRVNGRQVQRQSVPERRAVGQDCALQGRLRDPRNLRSYRYCRTDG